MDATAAELLLKLWYSSSSSVVCNGISCGHQDVLLARVSQTKPYNDNVFTNSSCTGALLASAG